MYGAFDFDRMNETDVRENILSRLLRELGYAHSTPADIITEQPLRYPRLSLGRKKPADPFLRGKVDYILEIDRRLRWVVEAKAPNAAVSIDDREQAWSYANHPEVRGIYALVSNGREFEIYRANEGPHAPPILAFSYEQLEDHFQTLKNLLGPDSLRRDFGAVRLDVGRPLGRGLRSFAKIASGSMTYTDHTGPIPMPPHLSGLTLHLVEGAVERYEGKIFAYLKVRSSHRQLTELTRTLGIENFELSTDAADISTDSAHPTVFQGPLDWTIPAGTPVFDIVSGTTQATPVSILAQTVTTARGALVGRQFHGAFVLEVRMTMQGLTIPFRATGDFEFTIE